MRQLAGVRGVECPRFNSPHFKEFVADFSRAAKSVAEINEALLERGIFGGKDLAQSFPSLGGCALYCVTEMHTKDDIDHLVATLKDILE